MQIIIIYQWQGDGEKQLKYNTSNCSRSHGPTVDVNTQQEAIPIIIVKKEQ